MNEITLPQLPEFSTEKNKSAQAPALKHPKVALGLALAGLALFLLMLISYLTNSLVFVLDEPLRRYFEAQQNASSDQVAGAFKIFERVGSDGLTIASVFFILMWLVRRKWRPFSLMFVGIAGMELTWLAWLYLIGRPRPEEVISKFSESSLPSFPSGHTMFFVTFFTLIVYIYLPRIKNKRVQILIVTALIGLMLMTGWIRMFFGAHFFTDVLAGYGWGLFWAVASIMGVEYYFQRKLAQSENT